MKHLLVTHAKQLEREEEDILTAQESIRRSGLKNKAQFDKVHRQRKEVLKVGDMVLLYNTILDKRWSKKLDNRWLGPYWIRDVRLDLGTYLLSELDRAKLNGVYTGDRLTRYFQRKGIKLDEAENATESGPEEEVEEETDDDE